MECVTRDAAWCNAACAAAVSFCFPGEEIERRQGPVAQTVLKKELLCIYFKYVSRSEEKVLTNKKKLDRERQQLSIPLPPRIVIVQRAG